MLSSYLLHIEELLQQVVWKGRVSQEEAELAHLKQVIKGTHLDNLVPLHLQLRGRLNVAPSCHLLVWEVCEEGDCTCQDKPVGLRGHKVTSWTTVIKTESLPLNPTQDALQQLQDEVATLSLKLGASCPSQRKEKTVPFWDSRWKSSRPVYNRQVGLFQL